MVRFFGAGLLVFAAAIFVGLYKDITTGKKSMSSRSGPTKVYTREKDPNTFLLTVGMQFGLGLVCLGGGMYVLMRPE